MNLQTIKSKIDQSIGVFNLAKTTIEKLDDDLIKQSIRAISLELAQPFLQRIAKETQDQLKFHLTDIGQLALDTCYPDKYEFDIEFEIKRGKTEAKILLWQDDNEVDPMTEAGGGVVDLLAFALRIAILALSTFERFIILDEPFRFLSRDLQPKAMLIMKRLSEEMGIQFVMVTHSDIIIEEADRIIKVSNEKGKSQVEVIDNE